MSSGAAPYVSQSLPQVGLPFLALLLAHSDYPVTYCTRYAAFDAIATAHVYHMQGGRGVQAAEARRAAKRTRRRRRSNKSSV